MDKYSQTIAQWDKIFQNEDLRIPKQKGSGNQDFDDSLSWLTENASSVIDFGCGNGSLLFLCSHYGTTKHVGIDLSAQAIAAAITKSKEVAKLMPGPQFLFTCGSLEALQPIASASIDGAILSNIIDNLYPEDAHRTLTEIKRILKPEGRLLVKLNPLLTPEQISEYGVKIIKDNLLDDGMILWNNSTKDWDSILSSYFDIDQFKNIYYEEHDQYNRLYQLINS